MRRSVNLCLLVLLGCASPSHPGDPGTVNRGVQVQPGRQFDLAVGQEAQVHGTGITVRFDSVTEDSRCAVDVQCVWAGNAVVRLGLSTPGKPGTTVSLNTTLDPKTVSFEGYRVSLAGLKPQPRSGTPAPTSSYVASLEVSR
jgi:hypothetical protein